MITASHNPPEYNGYKVYWNDGAQVTPPIDQNIIKNYNSITDFSTISHMPFEKGLEDKLIHWVGEDVEDAYFKSIDSNCLRPELCQEKGGELGIVYTPIHGTGLTPCSRVLEELGFKNVHVVESQAKPDENFPTVKSPNPENPEALELAVDLMKKKSADIVFGTDPDTDRLGIALLHKGEIIYPNGNQIGLLMLHYILETLEEKKALPKNPYFIHTIVTTPLQKIIAEKFGVSVESTLTGFKWICSKMRRIDSEEPHRNFLFATEESFGYLNHNNVRDKDGVSSLSLMSEIALWYKTRGMTLIDGLNELYEKFGFSEENLLCLNYYGKEGSEKIGRIMDRFRSSFTAQFMDEEILSIEDYHKGEVLNVAEGQKHPLDFPQSNVLCYNLVSGDKICVRPSGTEPKIKFYVMIREDQGTLIEKKEKAKNKTNKVLEFIKKEAELS
jgi:phosphoglucomutase